MEILCLLFSLSNLDLLRNWYVLGLNAGVSQLTLAKHAISCWYSKVLFLSESHLFLLRDPFWKKDNSYCLESKAARNNGKEMFFYFLFVFVVLTISRDYYLKKQTLFPTFGILRFFTWGCTLFMSTWEPDSDSWSNNFQFHLLNFCFDSFLWKASCLVACFKNICP